MLDALRICSRFESRRGNRDVEGTVWFGLVARDNAESIDQFRCERSCYVACDRADLTSVILGL